MISQISVFGIHTPTKDEHRYVVSRVVDLIFISTPIKDQTKVTTREVRPRDYL